MLLKTCCCGISLKNGTIFVASLSMIVAIINVIGMGIHIDEIQYDQELHGSIKGFSIISTLETLILSWLIYSMVHGIFAGLVIVGTIKKSPGYLFPWIAMGFAGLSFVICVSMALLILSIIAGSMSLMFAILLFIGTILTLKSFLWLIVYSHHKELVAEKFGDRKSPLSGEILKVPYNKF